MNEGILELDLHDAIEEGRIDDAVTMLSRGVDVNFRDVLSGLTPLHKAAAAGSERLVKLLIEHGAYVDNDLNNVGETAMVVAAFAGHEHIVRQLLAAGARLPNGEKGMHVLQELKKAGRQSLAETLDSLGSRLSET